MWGSWVVLLGLWRGGLLCVYTWQAGAHMLEVVFTERVSMAADDDPQPTAPLLAALKHRDPIVQVRTGGAAASMAGAYGQEGVAVDLVTWCVEGDGAAVDS